MKVPKLAPEIKALNGKGSRQVIKCLDDLAELLEDKIDEQDPPAASSVAE
jgi:hypothetical protein